MTRTDALRYARARVRRSAVIGLMACLGVSLIAQGAAGPPLTNTDVIKLVAARLSDAVIVTAIESAPRADFDLTTNALIALKQNGASDAVIAAMQKAMLANRPRPAAAPPAPIATPAPAGSPAAAVARAVDPVRDFHAPAAEPSELETLYLIDQSTGALTALIQQGTKEQRFPHEVYYYVPGDAAATRFRVGVPFGFAIRFASTITEVDGFALPLIVDRGKRFAAKFNANDVVHFDVRNLGQATSPATNSKKESSNRKDSPDTLYEITPREVLLKGEYMFYVAWKARAFHSATYPIGFDNR